MAPVSRLAEMAHDGVGIVYVGRRDGEIKDMIAYCRRVYWVGVHRGIFSRDDIRFHVQAMQRKMYGCMNFSCRLGFGGRESLEMYNEELRRACDNDLFRGFPLTFAVRALPYFVAAQHFLLAVTTKAFMDVATAGARNFDANAIESFVGGGCVLASCAAQTTCMLAGEEARDEGGLTMRVPVPLEFRDFTDWHSFPIHFIPCAERSQRIILPVEIEVFMKAIQQKIQVFLGILLSVHAPFAVQSRTEVAKGCGTNSLYVVAPKAAY